MSHRVERIPLAYFGRRGSVAMELALVSPLLMIMFLGCFEVTQLVRVYMGLGVAANAVADLVSRDTPDTAANIADACNGGKLIVAPFPGTGLTIAIASVTKKASPAHLR
ncbi:MAG TPA: TadE/TadG family type IV pilus assembly protein [Acetobacteraceae bacterium]